MGVQRVDNHFSDQKYDNDLKEEDIIESCSVPCYVELYQSNVCLNYATMAAELLYGKRLSELQPSQQYYINRRMEADGVCMWTDVIQHEKYLKLQKKRRWRRFLQRRRNCQSLEMEQPVDSNPGMNCDEQSGLDNTGRYSFWNEFIALNALQ